MKKLPTIDNLNILREKLNLLDLLRDIETAYKYLNLSMANVFIFS
jgi:hypothetical protein